jgi:hypothetical protein
MLECRSNEESMKHLILAAVVIFIGGIVTAAWALASLASGAPDTQPSTADPAYAAILYAFAANGITIDSPFQYDFDSPPYPPDSQEWRTREKEAFDAGVNVRNIVARVRGIQDTQWSDDASYLNPCREVAVNLGDAALYLDCQGEHAQAVQLVRDILQLADLLEEKRPSDKFLVRVLVGGGIRMIAGIRLQQIASGVPLTKDAANSHDLQFDAAHDLIAQLLKTRKPIELMSDVFGGPPDSPGWRVQGQELNQQLIETFSRVKAECTFAAISLACHMYKSDHGHWPASLNEMVPNYLPFAPPDPWTDEKQPFGFIVIKGGLPDGSDRPLIYCRCNSPDGMFYRVDRPQYSYYNDDGSDLPQTEQKHGGQFRDIVRWQPPANPPGSSIPTTAPAPSTEPSN